MLPLFLFWRSRRFKYMPADAEKKKREKKKTEKQQEPEKEVIKEVAKSKNLSVNEFINQAIDEKLKRLKIELQRFYTGGILYEHNEHFKIRLCKK